VVKKDFYFPNIYVISRNISFPTFFLEKNVAKKSVLHDFIDPQTV